MATTIVKNKTCTKCSIEYPATPEYFYADRALKSGLRARCKECCKQTDKKYRENHKEKILMYRKQYYQLHKEKANIYDKKYRQQHKEEMRARCRAYYRTVNGRLRTTYREIQRRCSNPDAISYKYYGGRGIKCLFETSDELIDYVVNELGVNPVGKQCHRIDNDGHYERGNITFLTAEKHRELHGK